MFREMRQSAAMAPQFGRYGRGYAEPYPGQGGGSVLPKVIGIVVAIGLIRMLASHKRQGGGWADRRREMIAEVHRELHRQDEARAAASAPAADTTKA